MKGEAGAGVDMEGEGGGSGGLSGWGGRGP